MECYESWIDRAKSSYELSKANISNIIYFEDLCYQAQQAVEKSLKGFLIYFGIEPEFTHNISKLLNELEKYTESSRAVLCDHDNCAEIVCTISGLREVFANFAIYFIFLTE